jgi:DNA modification methylase
VTAVVLRGDARSLPLPGACVDLIVTSPPYFGLRSYTDGGTHYDGQIGSEATPAEWLANLVACTAEWVRVLKPSGSLFVNLGDKFSQRVATRPSSHQDGLFPHRPELRKDWKRDRAAGLARMPCENIIDAETGYYVREKSLMGLPWRYAIACTDQLGLILRRDIVWAKPNGLPESVTDRCRSSHEYVFHLVKQPRYYSAVDAIREPHAPATHARARYGHQQEWLQPYIGVDKARTGLDAVPPNPLGKLPGSVWDIPSQPLQVPAHLGVDHFAAFPCELPRRVILGWSPPGICTVCGEGRRPVTVADPAEIKPWTMAQRNGRSWHGDGPDPKRTLGGSAAERNRIITGYACACTPYTDHPGTGEMTQRRDYNPGPATYSQQGTYGRKQAGEYERVGPWREYHLGAWTPPPTRPSLVVDPFGGTGTTALVADVLGRTGITVDRSMDYCRLARWRTRDPGERARAMQVPKPPPVPGGMDTLFDLEAAP